MNTQYNAGHFTCDIIDEVMEASFAFAGYTTGDHWNGWATPVFTKEEADRLTETLTEVYGRLWAEQSIVYDAGEDAYLTTDTSDEEPLIWRPIVITVDGEDVKVYPIGTYYWTWSTVAAV